MKTKYLTYAITTLVILSGCTNTLTQEVIIEPTDTQKPIIMFTSTVNPTDTLFPTNTPEINTVVFEESTSPDGTWTGIVTLTTEGENKDLLFKIFNSNTDQEWIIEQIDIDQVEDPPPGGYVYPYIFKWSQDNEHLYYSHLTTGGDGCFGNFKPGGFDLKRFDLSSGDVVVIRSDGATWMALSPNEKKLAFINTWGGNVSIIDVDNGNELTFPLPSIENEFDMVTDTSDMYWSPDGKSLIYAHYVGVCDYKIWYSYIILIDLESQSQTVLIDHSDQGYTLVEWDDTNRVLLKDNDEVTWWLDPTTKEITPAE